MHTVINKIDVYKRNNTLYSCLLIAFLIITINYFSLNLVSNTVDYFHDSHLSAALNYKRRSFWEGYLSNSLFSDILTAVYPKILILFR